MDIQVTLGPGKKVVAEYKGFKIQTDQPAEDGGENSAPSPFDLFLASLATCSGFYVLSFCQERKIPTEGIRLEMDCPFDPALHLVPKITIRIILPKEFPEKYRDTVVKVTGKCTVKRHLEHPPKIEVISI